jgi:DNA mismatch endonuclease (patch repair protein)
LKNYPEDIIKVPRFNEDNGFYTTKARSELMAKIKGKNTKPEQKLRKALWHLGYRYRKNVSKLPGKPDIVFAKYKLIVFIDGEFWHGYKWEEKLCRIKSNRDFWIPKIERNMQRDREVNKQLEKEGWTVIRFWEIQIKKDLGFCVGLVEDLVRSY